MALKGVGTVIKMDGRTLNGIRSLKVCVGLDTLSTVTLEFAATATVSGEGQVWVRDLQQGLGERPVPSEYRSGWNDPRGGDAAPQVDVTARVIPASEEGE